MFIALFCLIIPFSATTSSQETGRSIMEKTYGLKQPKDLRIKFKVTLISGNDNSNSRHSRVMTKIEKKYEDGIFNMKSLLRFSQPKEIKGTGFLIWDRLGNAKDDQWLYIPALRKVKRIKPSENLRSFQGTDFSYEDLSTRDINSDSYKIEDEKNINSSPCYIINAKPINQNSHYSVRKIWIDKKYFLIRRIEYFNKYAKLVKILEIPGYVKNNNYWTPTKRIMKNIQKNHATEFELLSVKYDTGINDNEFSERFLKRF